MKVTKPHWTLLTVLLIGIAKEAWVSQIHFQDVKPVQVAKSAPYIIEAWYRKDAEEDTPSGGMLFEVMSVKKAPTGQENVLVGKHVHIRVWQTSAEAWGWVRRIAETSGVRESPLIDQMIDAPKLMSDKPYVLFLHQGVKELEFVLEAQDAYLTTDAYQKILDATNEQTTVGAEQQTSQFTAKILEITPITTAQSPAEKRAAQMQSSLYELVDINPKWVLKLKILKEEAGSDFAPLSTYGIHSPVKMFGKEAPQVVGETFRFKVIRSSGNRLRISRMEILTATTDVDSEFRR